MKSFLSAFGTSALALAASAPMALADVSAADVWANWQDYSARSGVTIRTESESSTDGVLTLTGVRVALDSPELAYSADLGQITFTENGDGSVAVGLPAAYAARIELREAGESVTLDLDVTQEGLELQASGTPEALTYAYTATHMGIRLAGIELPESEKVDITADFSLGGISGTHEFGAGALMSLLSVMSLDEMTAVVGVVAPDDGGTFDFSMTSGAIRATSSGLSPEGVDPLDFAAVLAAGARYDGGLTIGNTDFSLDFKGKWDSMEASGRIGSSKLDFEVSAAAIGYGSEASDVDFTLRTDDMPFEQLAFKLASSAFGVKVPVARTEEPQGFSYLTRMTGLELDPALWASIDPKGLLSHDPISFEIDLSGTGRWLVDIFNPYADIGMLDATLPGELHSLDLNALELTGAGHSLTGNGKFTFSPDETMSWGGYFAPEGKLYLKLAGARNLVRTLTTIDFMSPGEARMFEATLGRFMSPGPEPDSLVTTIRLHKDGRAYANGQQIQ